MCFLPGLSDRLLFLALTIRLELHIFWNNVTFSPLFYQVYMMLRNILSDILLSPLALVLLQHWLRSCLLGFLYYHVDIPSFHSLQSEASHQVHHPQWSCSLELSSFSWVERVTAGYVKCCWWELCLLLRHLFNNTDLCIFILDFGFWSNTKLFI